MKRLVYVALQEHDMTVLNVAEIVGKVTDQIEKVIIGKRYSIELALTAFLCGGHVLIEDIPGVGKTTLAKTMASALGCVYKRVQFTPDLLPADITGSSIFNQKTSEFEFREGPIFANIVLADEINRATPRTQSSLLECMEEHQVTADGITYALPRPFFVIATENDIEAHGTYPLPEAQMDRFMMRLSLGYPNKAEEAKILARQIQAQPILPVAPAASLREVLGLQEAIESIYVDETIREYVVDVVAATRSHAKIRLGASPRGSLYLLHAAKAAAALAGRTFVLPDDVKRLATPVLAHRLILRPDSGYQSHPAEVIVEEILAQVPIPLPL
jgi:MoxR-like ATPase